MIFVRLRRFLLQKELLNPNQSGFRTSDSCVNQLIAITHEKFEAIDCNPSPEVRAVFLDTSKVFDWYGLLDYFMKSNLRETMDMGMNFITFLRVIYKKDSKACY